MEENSSGHTSSVGEPLHEHGEQGDQQGTASAAPAVDVADSEPQDLSQMELPSSSSEEENTLVELAAVEQAAMAPGEAAVVPGEAAVAPGEAAVVERAATTAGEAAAVDSASVSDPESFGLPADVAADTVRVLEGADGARVWVIGTAHYSQKSQDDAARLVRGARPDVLLVELCQGRAGLLHMDELAVRAELDSLTTGRMVALLRQQGAVAGGLYLLLLHLSAQLTTELGMAPGGEFRRAFRESQALPATHRCSLCLGDRPIQVTIRRALAALTLWKRIRLAYSLLTSDVKITREEVERCKERELLEEMLAELTGDFPALGRVFVEERDVFLAASLRQCCRPVQEGGAMRPARVVGVVGMGHLDGIVRHWASASADDQHRLLHVPPATLSVSEPGAPSPVYPTDTAEDDDTAIVFLETEDGQQEVQLVQTSTGHVLPLHPEIAERIQHELAQLSPKEALNADQEKAHVELDQVSRGVPEHAEVPVEPTEYPTLDVTEEAELLKSDAESAADLANRVLEEALNYEVPMCDVIVEESMSSQSPVEANAAECDLLASAMKSMLDVSSAMDSAVEPEALVGGPALNLSLMEPVLGAATVTAQCSIKPSETPVGDGLIKVVITKPNGEKVSISIPSSSLKGGKAALSSFSQQKKKDVVATAGSRKRRRSESEDDQQDRGIGRPRRKASRGVGRAVAALRRTEDSEASFSDDEEEEAGVQRRIVRGHLRIDGQFRCTQCSTLWSSYAELQRHSAKHRTAAEIKTKPFQALQPDNPLESVDMISSPSAPPPVKPTINVDIISVPADMWQCSECDAAFPLELELRQHNDVCHVPDVASSSSDYEDDGRSDSEAANRRSDGIRLCVQCDKRFCSATALAAHSARFHAGDAADSGGVFKRSQLTKTEFSCQQCRLTYTSIKVFERHLRWHADLVQGIRRYQCSQCNSAFFTALKLTKHINSKHKPRRLLGDDEGPARRVSGPGRPVGSTVKARQLVYDHISALEDGSFSCQMCSFVGKTKNQVFYHVSTKHNLFEGPKCEYCDRHFYSEALLSVHRRRHTGERPYVCVSCGRAFRQKSDLQAHIRSTHADLRPHPCGVCGKRFARRYSLTVHMRCHTNERNYPCPYCRKRFRASTYLTAHMRVHTGERPHACPICNKMFRLHSDIRRHIFVHSRDRIPKHQRTLRCLGKSNGKDRAIASQPTEDDKHMIPIAEGDAGSSSSTEGYYNTEHATQQYNTQDTATLQDTSTVITFQDGTIMMSNDGKEENAVVISGPTYSV